ncbi:hypothetical protein ACWEWM_22700, partial [Streptomyces tendae]
IKLPPGGFNPEVLTRYIKGGSLVNLGVHSVVKLKNRFEELGDSSNEGRTPNQGPRPTPSPSPQPSPKPRSTAFHSALAPTG